MGTRNLTCVVLNGEYIVAKYCQWDGYPSGQGVEILNFLRERFDRAKFLEQLELVEEITEDQIHQFYVEAGQTRNDGMVNMEVADRFRRRFPHLNRDMGGDILEFIQEFPDTLNCAVEKDEDKGDWWTSPKKLEGEDDLPSAFDAMGGKILLRNDLSFAKDGLFCEFAYVLDLDTNVLEVYFGFNKGEPGRFGDEVNEGGYRPVGLVKTYSLSDLPDEEMFLADLEEDEGDDG